MREALDAGAKEHVMGENQPNDLEDRAGHAADELSGDRATEPEAKPTDEKAEEIVDDVRAETGTVHDEEDTGDDTPPDG